MTKTEELIEKMAAIILKKMEDDENTIKFFLEENTRLMRENEQLRGGNNA